jgi:hypothetical protein
MLADSSNSNSNSKDADGHPKLELANVPGGAYAFELAAKFCYGTNFEITAANVAQLRCVAEYLEMTEDQHADNLVARAEAYLAEVALRSLDGALEVLRRCDDGGPVAEQVGLVARCVDAVAASAGKEQLVSGLAAHLETCDCAAAAARCREDWWVEDLSLLRIDHYRRVIAAMRRSGVRPETIGASVAHYAQTWLKGVDVEQRRRQRACWDGSGPFVGDGQRMVVETLVDVLATENVAAVTLSFLFGMLRVAVEVDASLDCRIELERRVGMRLEMAALDDLLVPAAQTSDSMFDVDTVHRILLSFLQRIDEDSSGDLSSPPCGYDSDGLKSPSHGSVLKVGRLMDGYLAEVAPDPYLKLQKFMALIELLPDYARIVDDGLYRAIDIYLKVKPLDYKCHTFFFFFFCSCFSEYRAEIRVPYSKYLSYIQS